MKGSFLKKLWCCVGGEVVYKVENGHRTEILKAGVSSVSPLSELWLSKRQLLESLYGGQFTLSTLLIKPNFSKL